MLDIFVEGGGIHEEIDKMLVSKILVVVGGAPAVTEMRRHLKIYTLVIHGRLFSRRNVCNQKVVSGSVF